MELLRLYFHGEISSPRSKGRTTCGSSLATSCLLFPAKDSVSSSRETSSKPLGKKLTRSNRKARLAPVKIPRCGGPLGLLASSILLLRCMVRKALKVGGGKSRMGECTSQGKSDKLVC